jgi:membrane protein DedA with SNARE-associated domain
LDSFFAMWAHWIQTYGYLAVFLGGVLEGETILIIAGYSISQEYLAPVPTFVLAAAGGAFGDFVYFNIGRRYGPRAIRRFPFLRPLRARAALILRRWGRLAAFLTRFAYGLRIALPMTMGAARFPIPVFLIFNLFGALTFAAVYLSLGFLFGHAIEDLLGRVRPFEKWILLGLVATGAVFWAVREWRLYHAEPEDDDSDEAVEAAASRPDEST